MICEDLGMSGVTRCGAWRGDGDGEFGLIRAGFFFLAHANL